MLANCTVTFEDGRTIHCLVDNFDISYDVDESYIGEGFNPVYSNSTQKVSINGRITDYEYEKPKEPEEAVNKEYVEESVGLVKGPFTLKWGNKEIESSVILPQYAKGEDMGHYADEKACADEYYDNGNGLARKMRNLELDSDERLLRKHNLVELDGTLTTKGKNFLMNVVFDTYKDEVVSALQEIEAAEKEEEE